jgi:hypothetical protein
MSRFPTHGENNDFLPLEEDDEGMPDNEVTCSSSAVEKATAHFHKVSDELMTERCGTLEVALWKLANECDGLRAFEDEIRAAIGNTNWNVLRLRVDEAREILKCVHEDTLRARALKTPSEDILLATGKAG